MDTTPPEILCRIFQLACIDDGFAGRSLSLVSPRIRDISAPYKYHSICVTGAKRIANFATFLANYRPQIQYLKLDCTAPDVAALPRFELQGIWRYSNVELERMCMDINTILRILAPTLLGLFLIPTTIPLQLQPFTFPLLETFYLRDYVSEIWMSLTQTCLPALKRLDIAWAEDKGMGCALNFAYGATHYPSLTHFSYSHAGGGMFVVLAMYAGIVLLGGTPDAMKGLDRFLALDVLQIRAPTGSARMPELLGLIEALKLIDGFPTVTIKTHEDAESTELWRYVVAGGEGFMP